MKKQAQDTAGFTLIELLVVVAIIGILAAVSIPIFRDYTIKGFNAAAVADLRYFKTAMEAEFSNAYRYPVF